MTLAFICGCAGTVLDAQERAFIRQRQPWGLILFKRNVADPEQMRALTDSFRELVGRADAPVLIDQEGGRVQRMGPPHWQAYPSAANFGALGDRDGAIAAARTAARLIAHDLRQVGVNVDCTPVLDVAQAGMHAVIGTRSWSGDPGRVAAFGRAVAHGLMAGGVAPVIKHIPGHGRASVDSHLELPVVSASRADLEAHDFAPFVALRDLPMAMTAHVVYDAIDPTRPTTTSRLVVDTIIRGVIGFDGLLLSDDMSMKALGGPFAARAAATFAAGVDIALHCNGDLAEAREVAASSPVLAGKALERARAALATIAGGAEPFDVDQARAELASAFEPAATH
ncbi:beta-N-acetylhexosaminidase [Methylocapsa sp. S129]|uniref:beta-N-acetylhexosaminidase n=1 Tax=Methylocapsa sp. S129 TaxID=1641869 RepID=UPI00131C1181|nr:beta-N-acetylhexosaminidase [Methylocapsa sp. S129]